jgi:methionyl-tRNA formyltransferase
VVTQPDRQKGRGLSLESTAVKNLAVQKGLEVYQPPQVNTIEALNFIRQKPADFFVVISYGQILSQELLSLPAVFALNVHASLLPKYRGAAPISRAIISGDKTTGVTIMRMVPEMDAGPIVASKSIDILEDDDAITLSAKLSFLAADLLKESILAVNNNKYQLSDQNENQVTFAPKLKKNDGLINWNKSAQEIRNLVRGCLGWPGAFSYYKAKILKIYKAEVIDPSSHCLPAGQAELVRSAGEILEVSGEGIVVATGKGSLIIKELQIEGKRRMPAGDFIAGHKILLKEVLGIKK